MRTSEEFSVHVENHPWLEGFVSVSFVPLPPQCTELLPNAKADWLSSNLGYGVLGDKWQTVSHATFEAQLIDSLKLSLAYSVEMLPPEEASSVAKEFLKFFDSQPEYLVNGTQHGWNPITRSTMETAYVVVTRTQAGMFLFEDED
jgi:hypothetical protein